MWCLSCLSTTCVWKWASGYALKKTTDVTSKKRLKCDHSREPRSLHVCRIWGGVHWESGQCMCLVLERGGRVRAGAVRSEHTHTHLPPVVHHKPSASHLLRTSRCGAKIHDNLCIHLTSLFSHFILASGAVPYSPDTRTSSAHAAISCSCAAFAHLFFLRSFSSLSFFRFLTIARMYPPGLSAL